MLTFPSIARHANYSVNGSISILGLKRESFLYLALTNFLTCALASEHWLQWQAQNLVWLWP
jgi:hypothetical protein